MSREEFRQSVMHWADRIGVKPRRVQVQRLTRKWASCSTAGRLTFSTDLLAADHAFRNEVIVHELVHLIAPNHGRLFKSLLRAHLGKTLKDRIAACSFEAAERS